MAHAVKTTRRGEGCWVDSQLKMFIADGILGFSGPTAGAEQSSLNVVSDIFSLLSRSWWFRFADLCSLSGTVRLGFATQANFSLL